MGFQQPLPLDWYIADTEPLVNMLFADALGRLTTVNHFTKHWLTIHVLNCLEEK